MVERWAYVPERPRLENIIARTQRVRERQESITIPGQGQLEYLASVGTVLLSDGAITPKPRASMSYTASRHPERENKQYPDPTDSLPVIFVWNGGPNASGQQNGIDLFDPWIIQRDRKGNPQKLIVNNHTPLLYAEAIVNVDPVGTGFGRVLDGEDVHRYCSVENDAAAAISFMDWFLKEHHLENHPVILAGSSFSAYRLTAIALERKKRNKPVAALDLISPAFDIAKKAHNAIFKDHLSGIEEIDYAHNFTSIILPMARIAQYHNRLPGREQHLSDERLLENVTLFMKKYVSNFDFFDDPAWPEREEFIQELMRYTGLPFDLIDRLNLKISQEVFCENLLKDEGKIISASDGRFTTKKVDSTKIDVGVDAVVPFYEETITKKWEEFGFFEKRASEEDIPRVEFRTITQDYPFYKFSGLWKRKRVTEAMIELRKAQPDLRIIQFNGCYDLIAPLDYTVDFWNKVNTALSMPSPEFLNSYAFNILDKGVFIFNGMSGHSIAFNSDSQVHAAQILSDIAEITYRKDLRRRRSEGEYV